MRAIDRNRARSALLSVLVLALWGHAAGAAPAAAPEPVEQPPQPPDLAPLNPEFQAAMTGSRLQAYRYNQLAEEALALKRLCETGFGPAALCPKANGPAGAGQDAEPAGLPVILSIDGMRGHLSAILALADGRRLAVRTGTILPGNLTVGAIDGDGVRLRTPGGGERLLAFAAPGGAR